jgi:ATP-dependent Zn protease
MNSNTRRALFFGVLLCVAAALWVVVRNTPNQPKATYTQFLEQVQTGAVKSAVILAARAGANQVTYSLMDGGERRTMVPLDYGQTLALMQEKMVNIEIRDASFEGLSVLANSAPFLVLLGFWFFMLGRLKSVKQPLG